MVSRFDCKNLLSQKCLATKVEKGHVNTFDFSDT